MSSDDLSGLRVVRDALDCDVAAGEYGYDEPYFARMVAAGAVDCLQIDVTRCGGYTERLRQLPLPARRAWSYPHCARTCMPTWAWPCCGFLGFSYTRSG